MLAHPPGGHRRVRSWRHTRVANGVKWLRRYTPPPRKVSATMSPTRSPSTPCRKLGVSTGAPHTPNELAGPALGPPGGQQNDAPTARGDPSDAGHDLPAHDLRRRGTRHEEVRHYQPGRPPHPAMCGLHQDTSRVVVAMLRKLLRSALHWRR